MKPNPFMVYTSCVVSLDVAWHSCCWKHTSDYSPAHLHLTQFATQQSGPAPYNPFYHQQGPSPYPPPPSSSAPYPPPPSSSAPYPPSTTSSQKNYGFNF